MTAQLQTLNNEQRVYDFAIGFGPDKAASSAAATQSLAAGYDQVLAHYNGQGEQLGWEDYLASLGGLATMIGTTTDDGHLLHASAMA